MPERRVSMHVDRRGEVLGVSIDPDLHSEPQLDEFTTRTLEHGGIREEILLFRRGKGLAHITADDLHDLRLMFKHGDYPDVLIEGVSEEFRKSKRVTKKPAKTTTSS